MELYNFDRRYQLYISYPEKFYVVKEQEILKQVTHTNVYSGGSTGVNTPTPPEFLSVPSGDKGVLIEDLKIVADINATTESNGSDAKKATIKIYNLSPSTRHKIVQKNSNIILKAGYYHDYKKDALPVILVGQVSRVYTDEKNITTLEISDGFVPRTTVKVSKSIEANYLSPISAVDVLDYLVSVWKENGIASSKNTIYHDFALQSVKYYAGWTGEGYLKDIMDHFCESHGLQWYITNSSLYVQPKGNTVIQELFILDDTNLIGIESISNDNSPMADSPDQNKVKITTFLDGRIREGKFMRIEDNIDLKEYKKHLKGTYKVISVKHKMDYTGTNWKTICECEKV